MNTDLYKLSNVTINQQQRFVYQMNHPIFHRDVCFNNLSHHHSSFVLSVTQNGPTLNVRFRNKIILRIKPRNYKITCSGFAFRLFAKGDEHSYYVVNGG